MSHEVFRRILVVDDHGPLLDLLATTLDVAGYVVISASGAEQALAMVADLLPDLVVSDVMMPGFDGYALVEALRANPRTELIPVVFVSGKATRQDRIKGLRAGVDAYLTKPVEPDELVAVVDNILARVIRTHRRIARLPRVFGQAAGAVDTPTHPDGETRQGARVDEGRRALGRSSDASSWALTGAERRVAAFVAQGLSNKGAAAQLGISYRTVEMHLSNIFAKTRVSNRVELALLMQRAAANDH